MATKKNEYGLKWIYKKTRGIRFQLLLYTVLIIINTVLSLSIAYFLKIFVDIATGDSSVSLFYAGRWALVIIVIGGIITMMNSVLSQLIYGKMECKLRIEIMSVIFSKKMIDISKQHTGELLTKLTTDIQAISNCFIHIIKSMIGGVISALLALGALFILSWKMALIMIILMPLLLLVMGVITPFMKKVSVVDKKNEELNRSIMQEDLSRIMLIKAYFMQNKIITKIKKTYAKKLKSGMKLGFWEGFAAFSGALVGNAMFMVALGVGAYFVVNGETTVGSLIAIVQLLNYIVSPVEKFAEAISLVSQATASSSRIGMLYELPADNEPKISDPLDILELNVDNLSFSYKEENISMVLQNIKATFSKGMVTGIVGKSGSGKSTLLKLLIGIYTPQKGTIELKHTTGILQREEIIQQIAYVPPAEYLFSGTVTENIIMSDEKPDLDEMKKAAHSANILDFIEMLPNEFDTLIGESGGTLSSGQAQRIAIARAIYKKAPIIIFDEPTANLDADSIEKLKETIKCLAKDKICILVTHDISTITICDKVYVIEQGYMRERRGNEEISNTFS